MSAARIVVLAVAALQSPSEAIEEAWGHRDTH